MTDTNRPWLTAYCPVWLGFQVVPLELANQIALGLARGAPGLHQQTPSARSIAAIALPLFKITCASSATAANIGLRSVLLIAVQCLSACGKLQVGQTARIALLGRLELPKTIRCTQFSRSFIRETRALWASKCSDDPIASPTTLVLKKANMMPPIRSHCERISLSFVADCCASHRAMAWSAIRAVIT